jgi:hypothetical protein
MRRNQRSILLDMLNFFRRKKAQENIISQQDDAGCVACGSENVTVEGDQRTCLDCEYVGRADGGGVLDSSIPQSIHTDLLD